MDGWRERFMVHGCSVRQWCMLVAMWMSMVVRWAEEVDSDESWGKLYAGFREHVTRSDVAASQEETTGRVRGAEKDSLESWRIEKETMRFRFESVEEWWLGVRGTRGPCAICLEDYQGDDHVRMLPCLHDFHVGCVDGWLVVRGVCPVCRGSIRDNSGEDHAILMKEMRHMMPRRTMPLSLIDESAQVSWSQWARDVISTLSLSSR